MSIPAFLRHLFLPVSFLLLPVPSIAQTPLTNDTEEKSFIELSPPPTYSYKKGSVRRYTENSRRFVFFEGTTLIPPYFSKNAEYAYKPIWSPDPKLSVGRWLWEYRIDCDDLTFDRSFDQVGWRSVRWDPTAMAASALFCPVKEWEKLTVKS